MNTRKFGSFGGDIERITMRQEGSLTMRPCERYGKVELSLQASRLHYCTPREDGLPLDAYASVEVGFLFNGHLAHPSAAGIEGFDDLFEEGASPVAGNVPQADVQRLRDACAANSSNN